MAGKRVYLLYWLFFQGNSLKLFPDLVSSFLRIILPCAARYILSRLHSLLPVSPNYSPVMRFYFFISFVILVLLYIHCHDKALLHLKLNLNLNQWQPEVKEDIFHQ